MPATIDPLQQPNLAPERARELFDQFATLAAKGYNTEDVAGAATNVLINALRQAHGSRSQAEQSFDERFGRAKSLLLSHYDGVTGRRRNIFPFDQVIEMPYTNFKGKTRV